MKAILTIIIITFTQAMRHNCIHDQIIEQQHKKNIKLMPVNDTHLFELDHRGRRLQSDYGPIRFHIVYNDNDVVPSTPTGQSIIRMMNIIQLFWQKTIEVYYLPALSFNVSPGTNINNA
jgi:hypothetical protein